MNRGLLIAIIFIYLALVTLLCDALTITSTTNIVDGVLFYETTSLNFITYIGTFWNLLFFNVTGIPVLLNLFMIYPAILLLLYNFVMLIRGV